MPEPSPTWREALEQLDAPSLGGTDADPLDLVWRALGTVIDPEIGLDIVTIGLVYGVDLNSGIATITHTLTTPGCPMEEVIGYGIENAVAAVPGVDGVRRELVWDPPWSPGMIQEVQW